MTEEDASEPDDTTVGVQDAEVDEESLEESESIEPNVIDSGDFSTLELTLEEARRQYDDEERRRAASSRSPNEPGFVVVAIVGQFI